MTQRQAAIRGVSEEDFGALMWAANEAQRQGKPAMAERLDVMARKANASLAHTGNAHMLLPGMSAKQQRWQDIPSTLMSRSRAAP